MRIFIFCFCFVLVFFTSLYASDWKKLHETSDMLNIKDAKSLAFTLDNQYILGLCLLNEHQDDSAAEVFKKILDQDKNYYWAEWGVAEVMRRKHELVKSAEILNKISSQHPDFAPAIVSLAYINYLQLNLKEAIKLSNLVISMGKDKVDLSNYVRSILMIGGAKGMIAHFGGPISKIINGTAVFPTLKKAEKLQPNSGAVMFGLGSFYLLAPSFAGGDPNRAKEYLQRSIKLEPLFPNAYVRLAQVYQRLNDKEKYEFYLNKALEIDPGNELALDIKEGKCKFICFDNK